MAGKNVKERPKGTGIQWRCKGPEAGKSLVSFEKLIGGGSLWTEAELREGVHDRILWEWRARMESGSAPVPVPTFPSEALLSPNHVSGAG